MDTLSVNLSRGDVAVLLRVVEQALEGCACGRASSGGCCDRCEALNAVRLDLARVVARRPSRRVAGPVRWGADVGEGWSEGSAEDALQPMLMTGLPLAC
jgi:hypothetical protein